MQTRRRRALSAVTLVKLPVEILLSIVNNVHAEADLLSLSQVSKALRELSATVLFRKLYVDVDLETFSDLLEARVRDPWVCPAIREVHIDSWTKRGPPVTVSALSAVVNPLAAALQAMTGLVKVHLAAWMVTDPVLSAIYQNRTIRDVVVIGHERRLNAYSLMAPLRPPSNPLRFDLKLIHQSYGKHSDLDSNLLYYIRQSTGHVDALTIRLDKADLSPPTYLFDPAVLPAVKTLKFEMPAANAQVAASWLSLVPTHLTSLEKMGISVTSLHEYDGNTHAEAEDNEPFYLTNDTWLATQEGMKPDLVDAMFVDWAETLVMAVEFERHIQTQQLERLSIIPDFGAVLKPAMIRSLANVLTGVTVLELHAESFADSPEWEDWPSAVAAFAPLTSLKTLSLMMSVTPSPTMEVVVGCQPSCITAAEALLPYLKTDMALLGGNFGLWTLGIDLNLRRIELLGPHLPVGARVCWLITDTAEVEPAVNFAGFIKAPVEEGKSKTLVMEEVQEEMEWQSGQRCTVCHADMVAETPMELLMTCPVEEVRASLSRTKKDWEDWVKSEPPSELSVFERWLRRM